MKELPPDPMPWTPPAERWYDRHEHTAETSVDRTLTAMRLTVYDRLGIACGPFKSTPALREAFTQALRRHPEDMMSVWRDLCSGIRKPVHDGNAEAVFCFLMTMMSKGEQWKQ